MSDKVDYSDRFDEGRPKNCRIHCAARIKSFMSSKQLPLEPSLQPYKFIMHFRTQIQALTLAILVLYTTHTTAWLPCTTSIQCWDFCLPGVETKCVGMSYRYFLRTSKFLVTLIECGSQTDSVLVPTNRQCSAS